MLAISGPIQNKKVNVKRNMKEEMPLFPKEAKTIRL
jgi:hypothetical protein